MSFGEGVPSSIQVGHCEVCGGRAARYVCQECGRQVCERCLEPQMWVCSGCYGRLRSEAPVVEPFSWSVPLQLFYVGFLLLFVGIVLVMVAGLVSGGSAGFVWIFPFPPIVLGSGWFCPVWAAVFTIVLTVVGVVLLVLFRERARGV